MKKTRVYLTVNWIPAMMFAALLMTLPLGQTPARDAFFESRIRPILVEHCQKCHGASKEQAGLRLDNGVSLRKGSDSGPVVVPGKPEQSTLIQVIHYMGESKMPPKGKLSNSAIADLTQWVRDGAHWPATDKVVVSGPPSPDAARESHWAFRPVVNPPLPAVKAASWVRDPLDHFILSRLEAKGLIPAPEVDRVKYIRRVTYDLTGLPPTPEEVDAFVADSTQGAYERLVDRLLASPRFGERWARHWMDISRYADTKGYVFMEERRYPFAWTYRDWLITAINTDMPYDRFVACQLAADLWPGAEKKDLAALGFLTLGRRFLNNTHDIIDDRIDVTMRGLMGLTVTCARCHDHKFDPVPSADYYSLHGIFLGSTEPKDLPVLDAGSGSATFMAELAKFKGQVEEQLVKYRREVPGRLRAQAHVYMVAARDAAVTREERVLPPPLEALTRRPVVELWRKYLEQAARENDRVFAAWRTLGVLKPAEWKAKGPGVLAALKARASQEKWPAPLVELVRDLPEHHMALAERYKVVFEKAMASPIAEDLKPVRAALVGPTSPCDPPSADIEKYLDRAEKTRLQEVRTKLDAFVAKNAGEMPRAMALAETGPQQPRVFLRGNPGNPGPTVPRQFLAVLAGKDRKPFSKGTGRLELAQSVVSPGNPLTSRVAVNRLWMLHFGQGLSRTPGDFGLRGDVPTHPELLDYLAARLVSDGWSMKKLHRAMVLSATYRQSNVNSTAEEHDPENHLWARTNRRKLEFEALRDGMLAASGRLDTAMGGPAIDVLVAPFSSRRSVYGFIDRQNLPGTYRTFDLASPDLSTPVRHATTVPQQALYLLNSPFSLEMGRALAARPEMTALNPEARIARIYRLAYGRLPEPDELKDAVAYSALRPAAFAELAQAILCSNEFQFVD